MTDEESLARGIDFVNKYFFYRCDDNSDLNWTNWAYGIINTDKTLRFIDSTVQDSLRSISSGKLGNARYRITYEDLTKAGYRSLVHDYYHHELPNHGTCTQSLCGLHPSDTNSS